MSGNVEITTDVSVDLLVALLDELWPISNRAGEHAAVNEIKLVAKCPRIFYVVNVKREIRRDAVRCVNRMKALIHS